MALPSAVKKKAEAARQQIAAAGGNAGSTVAPRSAAEGYVDVSQLSQQPDTNVQVAPVSAAALATQAQAVEQLTNTAPPAARAREENGEGFVPHVLANVGKDGRGVRVDTHEPSGDPNAALSAQADTDSRGVQGQSPDFIDPSDWQARYTALRSSRDARVSALEQEVSELRSTNENLAAQLQELQGKGSAAPSFELDDATRERLGPEQAALFDRFKESVDQRFSQVDQQRQRDAAIAAQRFRSDLSSQVPRWEEINVNPGFLSWLDGVDQITGLRRQTMLDQFVRDGDATSAAALFRAYALASGQVQQRNGQTLSPEVSGARAGLGAGAQEQVVEVWSHQEIADFFNRKNALNRAGRLKPGTPEYDAVMAEEQRIRKAYEEGRVQAA